MVRKIEGTSKHSISMYYLDLMSLNRLTHYRDRCCPVAVFQLVGSSVGRRRRNLEAAQRVDVGGEGKGSWMYPPIVSSLALAFRDERDLRGEEMM